jgi:DNA-binding response OmpR family regulator
VPSFVDVSEPSQSTVLEWSHKPAEPSTATSALLASADEQDHRFLDHLFFQKEWTLFSARTVESALSFLRESPTSVVIIERDVPGGGWKKILSAIQQLARPPLLVVTSRLADDHLWAEVLNLGGHDVLAKPFRTAELVWVLENAWRRVSVRDLAL